MRLVSRLSTSRSFALGLRGRGRDCVELGVDAGEERGEFAYSGAGGEAALLVVAELVQDELEVAVAFVIISLSAAGSEDQSSLDARLLGHAQAGGLIDHQQGNDPAHDGQQ